MKINFNPQQCISCLNCMTIEECRLLIDMIRTGGPKFREEKCDISKCTKCIDICSTHALSLNNNK